MRKRTLFIAMLVSVVALGLMLSVGVAGDKTKTVIGEAIDVVCYTTANQKGEGHKECATACAKNGLPVGILEDKTNKVYIAVTKDHKPAGEMFAAHMAHKVKVTGKVSEKNGARLIEVESIEMAK
jgi:predicted lipoprotein with Yx(FWY)xxD motif